MLQRRYPKAKVYSILNSELQEEVNESLHDIEKQNGHPSIKGMKAISDQLQEAIR